MDIKIPEVGESISEGTIASWLKQEGDSVAFGEVLLELETDKVNLEINSDWDGILQKVYKREGDTVQVGETVGVIVAQAAPAEQATQTQHAPLTNKDTNSSEAAGTNGSVPNTAPPSVRKFARERGIDLNDVRPANPIYGGRITREDIQSSPPGARAANNGRLVENEPATPHRQQKAVNSAQLQGNPAAANPAQSQGNATAGTKPVERIRMSRRRQTIARRLVEAQRTAAMLTTFNEVDMTAILDLRRRRKQSFQEKHDIGLGFMSFFTKAVVGALKSFPLLNAEIDGAEILMKKYYDIGIAVSTEGGLVVPVIRDADRSSFAEIERNISQLAAKARDNSLSLTDLQGGTFTITNGGVFGSLLSTPILNTPQVGILGMHTIQKRPVTVDDDRMENRPMMYIALSYDHRIVDGSEAVQFLVTVKELLEDPESLLLEG